MVYVVIAVVRGDFCIIILDINFVHFDRRVGAEAPPSSELTKRVDSASLKPNSISNATHRVQQDLCRLIRLHLRPLSLPPPPSLRYRARPSSLLGSTAPEKSLRQQIPPITRKPKSQLQSKPVRLNFSRDWKNEWGNF